MRGKANLLSRFRLAKCRLEELYKVIDPNQKPDRSLVETALKNLPDEIYDSYDSAVGYISSISNAKMALQWLVCAVRPLKIIELTELMDWKQTGKSDHRSIRRTFGSLISVSKEPEDDNNAQVELAHFTVREYLSDERVRQNVFKGDEYEAHLTIAHHCIEYLSYCASEEGARGTGRDDCALKRRPLLEYAINNWYRHALEALEKMSLPDSQQKKLTDGGEKTASALTQPSFNIVSMGLRLGEFTSSFLTRFWEVYGLYETRLTTIFAMGQPLAGKSMTTTAGHRVQANNCATPVVSGDLSTVRIFSGWAESTKCLLESLHPDSTEYRRAVKQAAYKGYEFTVDLLLELGASANAHSPNYDVLTAASTDRYHFMMMLLLEKDVSNGYGDSWWPEESAEDVITDGTSIARSLILAGADVAVANSMGETALHQVAANGKAAIARLLLSRCAKTEQQCSGNGIVVSIREERVSWRWKCRGTPLHWAVSKGHHSMVRLLINESANIAATVDQSGQAALHLAARDGDVGMTQLLLDKGSDIEAKDSQGTSSLHFASFFGNLDVLRCLLKNGADVHVCASDGATPLQLASIMGHKAVVTELLDRGVDVNVAEEDGFTALHMAAQEGHSEILQILLDRGARIESRVKYGTTALIAAARKGHESCIAKLLDHGAKINAENDSGQTALSLAAERGHSAAATLLLERGAGIGVRSTIWGPILNAAAYGGTQVVIQACIDRGDNLKERDGCWRTLIHFASVGGKVDMISTVLGLGHVASTRDKQGRNSLHFAATSKSSSAVSKILEQGIDPQLKDYDGWTALHWAAKAGDESVVKTLLEAGVVIGEEKEEWAPSRIAAFHGHTHLVPTLSGTKSTDAKSSEPEGYKHKHVRCDGCFLVCHHLKSSIHVFYKLAGIDAV